MTITLDQAYEAGWNACMNGVDGRYAKQFVANLNGVSTFFDSSPYRISEEISAAWTHGWLDAMEADDDEEPCAEAAGY